MGCCTRVRTGRGVRAADSAQRLRTGARRGSRVEGRGQCLRAGCRNSRSPLVGRSLERGRLLGELQDKGPEGVWLARGGRSRRKSKDEKRQGSSSKATARPELKSSGYGSSTFASCTPPCKDILFCRFRTLKTVDENPLACTGLHRPAPRSGSSTVTTQLRTQHFSTVHRIEAS